MREAEEDSSNNENQITSSTTWFRYSIDRLKDSVLIRGRIYILSVSESLFLKAVFLVRPNHK